MVRGAKHDSPLTVTHPRESANEKARSRGGRTVAAPGIRFGRARQFRTMLTWVLPLSWICFTLTGADGRTPGRV